MGYKNIRTISVLTLGMAVVFILLKGAITFGLMSASSASDPYAGILMPLAFAFLFMGQLAHSVSGILEKQADEIAELRRKLTEQRPAN
jgi:Na+-transporting methylmalonyl-CoA/oxaloacetate decarboxylase gamma subunit